MTQNVNGIWGYSRKFSVILDLFYSFVSSSQFNPIKIPSKEVKAARQLQYNEANEEWKKNTKIPEKEESRFLVRCRRNWHTPLFFVQPLLFFINHVLIPNLQTKTENYRRAYHSFQSFLTNRKMQTHREYFRFVIHLSFLEETLNMRKLLRRGFQMKQIKSCQRNYEIIAKAKKKQRIGTYEI